MEPQHAKYYSLEEDWDLDTLQLVNHHLEQYLKMLSGGMDLTLSELQEMAARQQQQIESQQQVLVAKEQRLKYLKQQEQRHAQLATEQERLRKLRDRVDAQEMKLKKLRALRGQAEQYKSTNGTLNSELDSVKALFNEKEKELSIAVAKVEQLTKQLEEIRNGKLNGINGETQNAAVLELEKLRKELMLRNKLNQQQNNKLAAQKELLQHKKDEMAKMDGRIQELQQRIKKRRSQQAEQNKNATNQNKLGGRPAGTNIAAVEPYIQHVPKDSTKDDLYTKSGFLKKDPKYQTLPPNTKFVPGEKNKNDDVSNKVNEQSKEMNNNEKPEEYKIPIVMPGEPPGKNSSQSESNQSHAVENQITSTRDRKPQNGGQSLPQPPNHEAGPISAGSDGPRFSVTNFAPRPFGSTYSTSVLGGRLPGTLMHQPVINITEEERQAGSGQSSPASSDSSQNSPNGRGGSAPQNNTQNVTKVRPSAQPRKVPVPAVRSILPQGKPQVTQRAPSHGLGKVSIPKHLLQGGTQNTDQNHQQSQQPLPNSVNDLSIKSVYPPNPPPRTSVELEENKSNSKQIAQSSSQQTSPKNGSSVFQGDMPDSSTFRTDSPILEKPQPQATSTPVTSGNVPNSQPTVTSSQAGNQKPTYRYASKNAIINTYMGRLGSAAMQKYQENLNLLYKNADSQDGLSKSGQASSQSSVGSMPSRSNESPEHEQKTAFNQPSENHTPAGTGSPTRTHTHFGLVGLPQYQSIASDKVSYKANTPKHIRRRHSDSDNEDLSKYLRGGYDKHVANQKINSGISNNQSGAGSSYNNQSENDNNSAQTGYTMNENSAAGLPTSKPPPPPPPTDGVVRRKKTNLKSDKSRKSGNRVSFDPLALLLDASLEGELDLVMKTAKEVPDVSAPNDEGITALHNAICAGHYEIVRYLVEFGCDVNSPDSDGWTPLHCAASCNNLPMVKFIVEHGACIFATTISDHETAAEKCEEDEDGYDGCSDYLYSIQEKLGILHNGEIYAVFDYQAQNADELVIKIGDKITILRKGDEKEKEWWWARLRDREGYVPRNLLGLYPRVLPSKTPKQSI